MIRQDFRAEEQRKEKKRKRRKGRVWKFTLQNRKEVNFDKKRANVALHVMGNGRSNLV